MAGKRRLKSDPHASDWKSARYARNFVLDSKGLLVLAGAGVGLMIFGGVIGGTIGYFARGPSTETVRNIQALGTSSPQGTPRTAGSGDEQSSESSANPGPPSPKKRYKIGESAVVGGQIEISLDSFEKAGEGGGRTSYLAEMSARNLTDENMEAIFCLPTDASRMVDTAGRPYKPVEEERFDSANCSDLQPGLSESGFEVQYLVSSDVQPKTLYLWADSVWEDDPAAWDVE